MNFEICLSFAGTERTFVREVADELISRNLNVFFDEYQQAHLWGTFLHDSLSDIYSNVTYALVFYSEEYFERMYTKVERQALLVSGRTILPIRMDDVKVPVVLQGLSYVDGRSATPQEIADMLIDKIKIDKESVQGPILLNMTRRKYAEALTQIETYLLSGKGGPLEGGLRYNAACCRSRMAEENQSQHRSYRTMLDEALRDLEQWMGIGPDDDLLEKIGYLNQDDDLLFVRRKRQEKMTAFFTTYNAGHILVNTGATGRSGCVDGKMLIATAEGSKPASTIEKGDVVVAFDVTTRERRLSKIINVSEYRAETTWIINGDIEVSGSQVIFERDSGWVEVCETDVGDYVMTDAGFVIISSLSKVHDDATHFRFSTDDVPHTFTCRGLICHNHKAP
ncbi:TIR domain-containing protein [Rhizobium leguminosarum]|uniref:TIR domain-containing protein n=1 Tax=Rhizobium leguminosarum TaxID=384 RepID=UPI001031E721|nr:TIR domain-containing protein [Rhizobium leguminosarum]TBF40458.1 TIR domain-containing protein [Rhizobium leguminosarum]